MVDSIKGMLTSESWCVLLLFVFVVLIAWIAWCLRRMWSADPDPGVSKAAWSGLAVVIGGALMIWGGVLWGLDGLLVMVGVVAVGVAIVLGVFQRRSVGRIAGAVVGSVCVVMAFVLFTLVQDQEGGATAATGSAEPVQLAPGSYVALGDSYSAGEGNKPFVYERCHRS